MVIHTKVISFLHMYREENTEMSFSVTYYHGLPGSVRGMVRKAVPRMYECYVQS